MKTLRKTLLPLLLLAWAAGCTTSQTPETASHYDPVFGVQTDMIGDNLLETPGDPRELIWLNASRVAERRGEPVYYLEVNYMANAEVGWLEIPVGETLTLTLDGQVVKLSGTGGVNMRTKYKKNFVKERALYKTDKALIQRVGRARSVQVSVRGQNGLIQRSFGPENALKFQKFAEKFAAD